MNISIALIFTVSSLSFFKPLPAFDWWMGFSEINEFAAGSTSALSPYARFSVCGTPLPFSPVLNSITGWGLDVIGTPLSVSLKPKMPEDTMPIAVLFSRRGSEGLGRIGLSFHRPFTLGDYGLSYDRIELAVPESQTSSTIAYADFRKDDWSGKLRHLAFSRADETFKFSMLGLGFRGLSVNYLRGALNGDVYQSVALRVRDGHFAADIGVDDELPYLSVSGFFKGLRLSVGYRNRAPAFELEFSHGGFSAGVSHRRMPLLATGARQFVRTTRFFSSFSQKNLEFRLDGLLSNGFRAVAWSAFVEDSPAFARWLFFGVGTGGTISAATDSLNIDARVQGWLGFSRKVHRSAVLNGIAVGRYAYDGGYSWILGAGVRLFDAVDVSYLLDEHLRYRLTILAEFRG